MSTHHILVIDDEPDIRALVKEILEDEGFEVTVAENAEGARKARQSRRPDLILLDVWMPDTDGITLLKEWSENQQLDVPVIVISGHANVETAVEATRLGAYDFIEKPLSLAKLLLTVQRALEAASLQRENIGLRDLAHGQNKPVGESTVIRHLRDQIRRIAEHSTAVFITGESGTGKEVFARYLHANSPRAHGPFIAVSVTGLAVENPAAEVFGSEEGGRIHFGSLEQANGGTLFLKDIADMDIAVQARLLGALENQSFLRIGGRDPVHFDARIVAVTSHNLEEEIKEGMFREDLYYHLNVVPLYVPPLREHHEDVPELLDYYVDYLVRNESLPQREFSPAAKQRLRGHDWPGNIRELKNLVQRLLILGNQSTIEAAAILGLSSGPPPMNMLPGFDLPLREAREQFERAYLEFQLQATGGSVSKVAGKVGMERTHLYRKLRTLGIDPKQIKEASR